MARKKQCAKSEDGKHCSCCREPGEEQYCCECNEYHYPKGVTSISFSPEERQDADDFSEESSA